MDMLSTIDIVIRAGGIMLAAGLLHALAGTFFYRNLLQLKNSTDKRKRPHLVEEQRKPYLFISFYTEKST